MNNRHDLTPTGSLWLWHSGCVYYILNIVMVAFLAKSGINRGNNMTKPADFKLEKTVQVINFFLNQDESKSMSKMKLLKLIWLADRYTMRNYGYSITHDDYYAMEHGPVGTVTKDILDAIKKNEYIDKFIKVVSDREIESIEAIDFEEFSETDLSTLRMVQAVYGKIETYSLREYTHKFPEWVRFEKIISSNGGSHKMHIEDFFKNPSKRIVRSIFTQDESVLNDNKEIFQEDLSLRSVFS